jgi:hypothetical protein
LHDALRLQRLDLVSSRYLYEELAQFMRAGGSEIACPLHGKGRVRADGNLFEPHADGEAAVILAVLARSHLCEKHSSIDPVPRDLAGAAVPLLDLAAWRPAVPRSVLLRRGAVPVLGWDLDVGDTAEPLRLWASPVSWAAADFKGLVVLDWAAVSARFLEWREIIAETLELGERVESELARARRRLTPRRPRISVVARA